MKSVSTVTQMYLPVQQARGHEAHNLHPGKGIKQRFAMNLLAVEDCKESFGCFHGQVLGIILRWACRIPY